MAIPCPGCPGRGTGTTMGTTTGTSPATSGQARLPLPPRRRWEQLLLADVIYAALLSRLYRDVVGVARASRSVRFQGKSTA